MARKTKRKGRKGARRARNAKGRFVRGGGKRKSGKRRSASKGHRKAKRKGGKRRTYSKSKAARAARRNRRKKSHFRTYKSLAKRYGVRRAAKKWRRSRKYVRSNPFGLGGIIPSMASVKDIVQTGAVAYVGYVGVNAGLMGLDMVGLAKLKASQGPLVNAAINAAARILLTGLVAKVGSKFLGLSAQKLALGGAFNVIYHGVQDVVAANPSMVPATAMPMLLGYDGVGDALYLPSGISDWARSGVGLLPERAADNGVTLA